MPGATEVILIAAVPHISPCADAFSRVECFLPKRMVLRSGCYLAHDSESTKNSRKQETSRLEGKIAAGAGGLGLRAIAPSNRDGHPEHGKARRPFDYKLPLPQKLYRGTNERKLQGCRIAELNDQHAYMKCETNDLRSGTRSWCGNSHPCTDSTVAIHPRSHDSYDVIDGILTFFLTFLD